jgi:hypothetical protein
LGYFVVNSLTWFWMLGTQVQNVNVVSVSRALSISDCGTVEADGAAAGAEPPSWLHAARNHALEAAAAVEIKNLRRLIWLADIAVLSFIWVG